MLHVVLLLLWIWGFAQQGLGLDCSGVDCGVLCPRVDPVCVDENNCTSTDDCCEICDTKCALFDCENILFTNRPEQSDLNCSERSSCARVCCDTDKTVDPEYEYGFWIDVLGDFSKNPTLSHGTQCLPELVPVDPFWTFKQRLTDMTTSYDTTINATSRMSGFVEWSSDEEISSSDLQPWNCVSGVLLLGTPFNYSYATSKTYVRYPFILQFDSGTPGCTIIVGETNVSLSWNSLRIWRRAKSQWHASDSRVNLTDWWKNDIHYSICNEDNPLSTNCPGSVEFYESVCEYPFIQCLSLPDGPDSFDPTDDASLWGLLAPKTLSPTIATARTVDLLLGKYTHYALLMTGDSYNLAPSLSTHIDLSLSNPNGVDSRNAGMLLLGIGVGTFGCFWTLPIETRAFFGSGAVIDGLDTREGFILPHLLVYAGPWIESVMFPLMPKVRLLQISFGFNYFLPAQQNAGFGQMEDIACAQMFNASYIGLSPYKCSLVSSDINDTCMTDSCFFRNASFDDLEHFSILGIADDLFGCLLNDRDAGILFPSLSSLTIEGSSMEVFHANNLNARELRLAHNPFLRNITNLGNHFTSLQLLGNFLLKPPNVSSMLALKKVSFSYTKQSSTGFFTLLPTQIESVKCISCSLSSFPSRDIMSQFLSLSYLQLSRNQIFYSLSELLSLSWFPPPKLWFLDLSVNAIYGNFPDESIYSRLFLPGRPPLSSGQIVQFNLDYNQIESFISLSSNDNNNNNNSTDEESNNENLNDIDSIIMFPPTFMEDIMKSEESLSVLFSLQQNNQIPWLSLKNNRLRGDLSAHLDYFTYISLDNNDYWCVKQMNDTNNTTTNIISTHPACIQHFFPIISTNFFPGYMATEQQIESPMKNWWPYALPRNEILTMSVTVRTFSNPYDQNSVQFVGQPSFFSYNPSKNISTVNLPGMSIDSVFNPVKCVDLITVVYDGTDMNVLSCIVHLQLTGGTATHPVVFVNRPVLLVSGCNPGRGYDVILQACSDCEFHFFSLTWVTALLPKQNIADLSLSCTACPASYHGLSSITLAVAASSVTQCVCPQNTFGAPAISDNTTGNGSIFCQLCEPKAAMICGRANLTQPPAQPGYFFNPINAQFLLCDPSTACVDGICAAGYMSDAANVACAACEPNHYRMNRECHPCNNFPEFSLFAVAIISIFGLLLLIKISHSRDFSKNFTLSISLNYIQIISIFGTFPLKWPYATRDMFAFLSFFNFNFDLAAPECAIKNSDFWSKWVMKIFLPILACSLLFIWYLLVSRVPQIQRLYLHFVTKKFKVGIIDKLIIKMLLKKNVRKFLNVKAMEAAEEDGRGEGKETEDVRENMYEKSYVWEKTHIKHRFLGSFVSLFLLFFTFAAKTSTQIFNCLLTANIIQQVEKQEQILLFHLRADASIVCYDDIWYSFLPLAIFSIFIYCFCIPLFLLIILIRAQQNEKKQTRLTTTTTTNTTTQTPKKGFLYFSLSDPDFLSMFGGLVLPFREQFWYWELIQLARKWCIICAIDFNGDTTKTSTFAQINSVLIILVIFLFLQEFNRPYDFTWCNRLEFAWTAMSLLVLIAALVFSMDTLTSDQLSPYAAFLIVMLVVTLLITVYCFVLEKRRSYVKSEIYRSRGYRVQEEHKLLGNAFGPAIGRDVYRNTKDMTPENREEFLDRVMALLRSSPELQQLVSVSNKKSTSRGEENFASLPDIAAASSIVLPTTSSPPPPSPILPVISSVAVPVSLYYAYQQNLVELSALSQPVFYDQEDPKVGALSSSN